MRIQELNGVSQQEAMMLAGIVPHWIKAHQDLAEMSELVEEVLEEYGFPISEMKGGTLYPDGTYDYPGDPDLKPNLVITVTAGRIYSYDYGMFAFFDNYGGTKMYRLD